MPNRPNFNNVYGHMNWKDNLSVVLDMSPQQKNRNALNMVGAVTTVIMYTKQLETGPFKKQ